MSNNKEVALTCINLHMRKLATSRMIQAYSREMGIITVSGSRLGGRSEPLVELIYTVRLSSRSDIHTIRSSEFIGHFSEIQHDYLTLNYIYFLIEILGHFSHYHDPKSTILYDQFRHILQTLDTHGWQIGIALRYIWTFIEVIGYQPDIRDIGSEQMMYFDIVGGDMIDRTEYEHRRETIPYLSCVEMLPRVQQALLTLASGVEMTAIHPDIQRLLLRTLHRYIHHLSDRKLKTLEILEVLL